MNKIRNNFFAGNDLLGDEKRKPATLKSYVVSYRLFLKFIVARQEDVCELMTITDTDLRQVQSALLRLDSWPKAYTDAFNRRKAEVRERDERERLSAEDFRQFTNSAKAKQLKDEYKKLSEDPQRAVDPNTFAELRDYLLVQIITASGQRCGAAGNLTLEEFDTGVKHTDDLYVTKTLRHKTAAGGPAKLMWDGEVKAMAETYKNNMRPLFANEKSVFPSSAGIVETPAFFITAAGQPMNESQISKRIVVLGKRLNPDMSGNLRGSRIRKGIITLQRAEESASVSDVNVAKQMSHSVSTAQKYYNITELAKSDIQVASYLKTLTSPQPPKEKKDEDEPIKIPIVPDPVAEDHQQEGPHDVAIRFVPDTGLITNLGDGEGETGGGEKADAHLTKEEKRELLTLFQDLIQVGWVPAQHIYNQRKVGHSSLRTMRYEKALDYMKVKSQIHMTPADKCKSWLATGEIDNIAASTTSSVGSRHYWTELQTQLMKEATLHLPSNAKASDILAAVCEDKPCREHHIPQMFSRQQIRDKFKNLVKKYNNLNYLSIALQYSGKASPTFGHANANFSVFTDRMRNQILKK